MALAIRYLDKDSHALHHGVRHWTTEQHLGICFMQFSSLLYELI